MSDLLTPSNAKKPGIGSLFTCRVNDDKKRLECVKKASFSLLFFRELELRISFFNREKGLR